jgi:cardiolipin synthase
MTARDTHTIDLLCGGAELFAALVAAIDQAQQEVRLETYIFDFQGSALDVANALTRAAQRGVRVMLVVDGAGTGALPELWRQRWDEVGLQHRVYAPITTPEFWKPLRWRRLHRKLCVVDQRIGFCGGVNLLDDWLVPQVSDRLPAPRLDYAVRVQGPVVVSLHDTMRQLWSRIEAVRELKEKDIAKALDALIGAEKVNGLPKGGSVRLVLRDNVRHRVDIERSYRRAIARAHHDIVLASAYFFPGVRLMRALVMAAQRGVRVQLLLQGHYEYFLPYRAGRHLYGQLLAAGVEISEYQPSFLHAKVAVIDQQWVTIGSSNLDPLSLLLAREANVVARAPRLAANLQSSLLHAIDVHAQRIQAHAYLQRTWWQRWVDAGAAAVLRFGVFLTGRRF